mmetsp:Transcript_12012/g.26739  ORF Transcript_12012/g.26739 Transcript_12012/m.26739 type:complete len:425 (-) Transcript_12012:829-2103(-)
MQHNLVAWNPSHNSQFASFNKDKLQLLEISAGAGDKTPRQITRVNTWETPQLTCLEWRPPVTGEAQALAYGTSIGSVHLVNSQSGEERSVLQPSKFGKRPCNAVSWNKHLPSQLVAGFENVKSEFCAVIWDFEHEYFVQSSFGEAACSLGWLPMHAFLFAVGTSMGWVKVYDTRISNQQGAASSALTHPAPRPRKVKGIRPDPHQPHVFATFSDFPGDAVKVWDVRRMATPVGKGAAPALCSVHPGTPEAVMDVAWCPSRPHVLGVVTSAQHVSFFSTLGASSSTRLAVMQVPSLVRSLSWQGTEARYRQTLMASKSRLSARERRNTVLNVLTPTSSSWESFRSDTLKNSIFTSPTPTPTGECVCGYHTPSAEVGVGSGQKGGEGEEGTPICGVDHCLVEERIPQAFREKPLHRGCPLLQHWRE